jgi:hypothetical protein
MHFCADEAILIMTAIPFVGIFFRTYAAKIHGWFHKEDKCPHKDSKNAVDS